MKNISSSAATSPVGSVSGLASPQLLPSLNSNNYPQGPLIKVVLYHPSLFKVESDFPNVIYIQDIPCNHFFAGKPLPTNIDSILSPVPDFVKNWQELILVPLLRKSLLKICTVLQIPDAATKADLILGVLGQGVMFRDQDIALSYDACHVTRHYLCTMQFKKVIANLDLSSEEMLLSPCSFILRMIDMASLMAC